MNKQQTILDLLAAQNERTIDRDLNALSGGVLGGYDIVTVHLMSLKRQGLIEYDALRYCALTDAARAHLETVEL